MCELLYKMQEKQVQSLVLRGLIAKEMMER